MTYESTLQPLVWGWWHTWAPTSPPPGAGRRVWAFGGGAVYCGFYHPVDSPTK